MDEAEARKYCVTELKKRGNPPGIDLDDLTQEYLLAKLEGKNPAIQVAEIIHKEERQSKRVTTKYRMQLVPGPDDDGMSDDEYGEYLDVEREIEDEQRNELLDKLEPKMKKMDGYDPREMEALKIGLATGTSYRRYRTIGDALKCTRMQARYLFLSGLGRLKSLAMPKEILLALFNETDEVSEVKEVYRRSGKPRFTRKEKDFFDVA